MSKKNVFIKKISNLLLSINNRIESFFNLIQSLKFDKKKLLGIWNKHFNNRMLILPIILVFGIIIYFLLPAFYDKNEIQNQIKNQALENYNLNIKIDKEPIFYLFPSPHFLIEEVKILSNSQIISNSKKVKFYISSKNNLKLNLIKTSKLSFLETDFKINKSNFNFFMDLLKNKNLNQKVEFIKNKIFYINKNDEIVFFSDVKKINYLFRESLLNSLNAKLDLFNLLVKLEITHDILNKNIFNKIEIDELNINIKNNLTYKSKDVEGLISLRFINKKKGINYSIKNKNLIFNFIDDQIDGKISTKPFFFSSNLNIKKINTKDLFKKNSIIINLLRTEILNNKNLNGKINVQIEELNDLTHINSVKFDIILEEGQIFISNLNFKFKTSTSINYNNVNIMIDDNKLKFVGDLSINFNDIQKLYNHFQIKRSYRKNISQINSNFVFNFDDGTFMLNELNIVGFDKKISDKYLNEFNSYQQNTINKIVFRNKVRYFFKMISLD